MIDEPDIQRVLDRLALYHDQARREAGSCDVCGNTTYDRKPYCVEHVTRMPYAIDLREQIKAGAMNDGDPDVLRERPATITPKMRLVLDAAVSLRQLDVDAAQEACGSPTPATARHYLDSLSRLGLLSVDSTPTGDGRRPRLRWSPTPEGIARAASPEVKPRKRKREARAAVGTDSPITLSVGDMIISISRRAPA